MTELRYCLPLYRIIAASGCLPITMATLLCWGLVTTAPTACHAQMPPAEQLLPQSTAAFVSITDAELLKERWEQTQLGKLMATEEMQAFREDLKVQFEDQLAAIRRRLGLTTDDIDGVAAGEIAMSYRMVADDRAAIALVVDVTGRLEKANALLEKVSESLQKEGATRTIEPGPEGSDTEIISFKLPEFRREGEDAAETDTSEDTESERLYPRMAHYFIANDVLGSSDDLKTARALIAKIEGGEGASFAENESFLAVMDRCKKDMAAGETPQIRWFIDPTGYAEALQASRIASGREQKPGKTTVDMMRNQGLDSILGVGGTVDFKPDNKVEWIHRTSIYAPQPRGGALALVQFIKPPAGAASFTPEPWVPRAVASYATTYFNMAEGFKHFGPVFNEFLPPEFIGTIPEKNAEQLDAQKMPQALITLAQDIAAIQLDPAKVKVQVQEKGQRWRIVHPPSDDIQVPGGVQPSDIIFEIRAGQKDLLVYLIPDTWIEILQGLKTDEDVQVDLPAMVANLDTRLTIVTDYQPPVKPGSTRALFAVTIKPGSETQVAAQIKRLFQGDPTIRPLKYEGDPSIEIWEQIVEEELEGESPGGISGPGEIAGPGEQPAANGIAQQPFSLMPHRAIAVVDGKLLIASHVDYLLHIIGEIKNPPKEGDRLSATIDFAQVNAHIAQLLLQNQCLRRFVRSDEEFRTAYQLLREGTLPESDLLIGRAINSLLGEERAGKLRKQKIDASSLPDYQIVRRYLGPVGMVIAQEDDGWFIKGFGLMK